MSKLKSVDTRNPEEFRQHLQKWNSIAALNGLELTQDEIDGMVRLHCDEGLSMEACIEKLMAGDSTD